MNQKSFFIHPTAVIDANVIIGRNSKIWHYTHIQTNAKIGKNCILGQNVYIASDVIIGDGVKIQNNVSVYKGVVLHDNVFCGPSVVFTNVLSPRSDFPVNEKYISTVVEEGASLGANSTIICGCKIGKRSLIAAGAVVTSDVPAYALMMGVPARRTGWVCTCGLKLNEDTLVCDCGRKYALVGGVLLESQH